MSLRRWLVVISLLAGLLLNNWILGIFLNWHLFFAGGSVSEFSASTQPHHWLFRSLDIAAGSLIALSSAGLLTLSKERKLLRFMAIVGIILGLANCLDALLPLPCSGTLDAVCDSPVKVNFHRLSLPDHVLSSGFIALGFLCLPIAGIYYVRHDNVDNFKLISRAATGLMIIFLIILALGSLIEDSVMDHLVGYSQELQMLAFGVWFARLARYHQAAPGTPAGIDTAAGRAPYT